MLLITPETGVKSTGILNYLKLPSKFTLEGILDHSLIEELEWMEHGNVVSAFYGPDAVLYTGNLKKRKKWP